jgi:hypothetical protein
VWIGSLPCLAGPFENENLLRAVQRGQRAMEARRIRAARGCRQVRAGVNRYFSIRARRCPHGQATVSAFVGELRFPMQGT